MKFVKDLAVFICVLIPITSKSQVHKYPVKYDAPLSVVDSSYSSYGLSSENYWYLNYHIKKDKIMYLKTKGEWLVMNDSLFELSIKTSPWANRLFDKSMIAEDISYSSMTVAGVSLFSMLAVGGFAGRFNIDLNNRFGRIFFISGGSIMLTGGLVALTTYWLNHYYRKKSIKVFNLGLKYPRRSFKHY